MGQNVYFESGFNDEDATILALEADVAVAIANYIRNAHPNNQAGAAKKLRIAQSDVSALLSANIGRFALPKLLRIARRAGLRMWLDMGENAHGSAAFLCGSVSPPVPFALGEAEEVADLLDYTEVQAQLGGRTSTSNSAARPTKH
jgi:predicted XRE-type DNA-binding protein